MCDAFVANDIFWRNLSGSVKLNADKYIAANRMERLHPTQSVDKSNTEHFSTKHMTSSEQRYASQVFRARAPCEANRSFSADQELDDRKRIHYCPGHTIILNWCEDMTVL